METSIYQTISKFIGHVNAYFMSTLMITYSAMSDVALNAKKMNVNPGGKQPLMRLGRFLNGLMKFVEHMVFTSELNRALAKGL